MPKTHPLLLMLLVVLERWFCVVVRVLLSFTRNFAASVQRSFLLRKAVSLHSLGLPLTFFVLMLLNVPVNSYNYFGTVASDFVGFLPDIVLNETPSCNKAPH